MQYVAGFAVGFFFALFLCFFAINDELRQLHRDTELRDSVRDEAIQKLNRENKRLRRELLQQLPLA